MASFKYTARSSAGEKVEGRLEAPDRRSAMAQVERLGYVPISVTEASAAAPVSAKKKKGARPGRSIHKGRTLMTMSIGRNRKARMKLREVLLFTGELTDLLASGMTLGNALNTLSRRKTDTSQDEIVKDLRDDIIQGASLSEALRKWPETFSALYVSMVRAGEAAGALPEALSRLREHYERVSEAQEKVLMALIYPSIILVMGGGTLVFAMVFVIPKFTAIFEELGSALPLPTRILIGVSHFIGGAGGLTLLALIIAGIIIGRRAVKTPQGQLWWNRMQLKIPVVKHIVTANAFAHFARTLGALLQNGVPILDALAIVQDTAGNAVIADEIKQARERVTDGSTISKPLAASKVFPVLLTDMLAVGEATGDMSGALHHIAVRYDAELDRNVKILTTVMEPILMVSMAVLVGFVAISMLMAVFDLTSGLNV